MSVLSDERHGISTIIVVNVNIKTKEIKLISIPVRRSI